ncbi:MAG: hypothetical protein EBS06_08000 [Proteobacteria bacterium]|nr:hypothetical protein [Pseudomonadota bacterium]
MTSGQMNQIIEDLKNKYIQKALRKKYYDDLRKKYYDDMPSERKDLWKKGPHESILCYCNRFYTKTSKVPERHKKKKNHQEFCMKIENEEKIIQEKNPEYILDDGEFLYKNQLIKYYYFTTTDILNNK